MMQILETDFSADNPRYSMLSHSKQSVEKLVTHRQQDVIHSKNSNGLAVAVSDIEDIHIIIAELVRKIRRLEKRVDAL